MRAFFVLGVVACASALPTAEGPPTVPPNDPIAAHDMANEAPEEPETVTTLRVPGRSAEELLSAAGLASYLEDRDLRVAQVDDGAMERWFSRKPSVVYLYSERPIEVSESETVRADCRRVSRADGAVLNELSVVLWQQGSRRALVKLGQSRVDVAEEERERGRWQTRGVRLLSVGLAAWDDEHARYAEGAEIHEVACVSAVRAVPCVEGGPLLGPRGHCLDRELVVRPWRAPTVPHVGGVIPAYPDRVPNVPTSDCAIECAPSACDEAIRRAPQAVPPHAPLYTDDAPAIAAFRTPAACRAFATSRAAYASNDGPW